MQIWRGVASAPTGWGRSVITIGVFDGVHLGHRRIIGAAVERARALGLASVVVTFDPHPSEVVRPGSHPAILTEPTRKAELIAALGVDVLCVIPFSLDFSRLHAESFAHDVLVEHLHAAAVVVGENFRFGHRAAGDVAMLARLGRTFGFTVEGASLVAQEEGAAAVVSSTYIRSCVAAGDVAAAAGVLGRPHRLEGVVVRGDQRGRLLGFPTANLLTSAFAAVPADGVYAAWLHRPEPGHRERRRSRIGAAPPSPVEITPADLAWPDDAVMAAVSIGTNPTFSGEERRVEAFLLDFDGDLYGERVGLDFMVRLREMRRYDSAAPLVAQIEADVAQTRSVLASSR